MNPQKKSPVELSLVILLANLINHILKSMTVDKFPAKENGQRVCCEKELHPKGEQHSVGIIWLLIGFNCPASDNHQLHSLFLY